MSDPDELQSTMKVQPLDLKLPPAKPPKKKTPRWQTALMAAIFIGGGAYSLSRVLKGDTRMSWQCFRGEAAVGCKFTADKGKGNVCMDVVMTCPDGKHKKRFCSGKLAEKEVKLIEIAGDKFKPPLPADLSTCAPKMEFEDKKID